MFKNEMCQIFCLKSWQNSKTTLCNQKPISVSGHTILFFKKVKKGTATGLRFLRWECLYNSAKQTKQSWGQRFLCVIHCCLIYTKIPRPFNQFPNCLIDKKHTYTNTTCYGVWWIYTALFNGASPDAYQFFFPNSYLSFDWNFE